jgi:hypothetical protein
LLINPVEDREECAQRPAQLPFFGVSLLRAVDPVVRAGHDCPASNRARASDDRGHELGRHLRGPTRTTGPLGVPEVVHKSLMVPRGFAAFRYMPEPSWLDEIEREHPLPWLVKQEGPRSDLAIYAVDVAHEPPQVACVAGNHDDVAVLQRESGVLVSKVEPRPPRVFLPLTLPFRRTSSWCETTSTGLA